jgi:DNA invertase Pin-like site-specific DNA recombinase
MTTWTEIPTYARLSRAGKGNKIESIPRQNEAMDRLALLSGHTLGKRFADANLSAWDEAVHRPEWELFLAELDTGEHRAAMTYHSDRLARNGKESERLLTIGARWGILLITPNGVYDLGDGDQRALFRMLATMVINQSDATSRRSRGDKDTARAHGVLRTVYGGQPPLGFCNPKGARDWQVHPADAAYLAEAAARVLADEPHHRVETAHKTLGPYTDQRGRLVTIKQLRAALQRPASAGIIRDRDGSEVRGPVDGYPIDPETWRKLAATFAGRKRGRPTSADGAYALGPALACGKCGNQLTGSTYYYRGAPRRVYACANPHKIGGVIRKPCKGVSIDAAAVNELLRGAVAVWSRTDAGREAARLRPETTGRLAELDAEEAGIHTLAAILTANVRAGVLSAVDYAEHTAGMAGDIARINAERDQLASVAAEPPVSTVDKWDKMTQAEKLRYVRAALVTPISVAPGTGGASATPPSARVELVPRAA